MNSRRRRNQSDGHQVLARPISARSPILWMSSMGIRLTISFGDHSDGDLSSRMRCAAEERPAASLARGRTSVGRDAGKNGDTFCISWTVGDYTLPLIREVDFNVEKFEI